MNLNESSVLKGVYTITRAKLKTARDFALDAKIRSERAAGRNVENLIRLLNSTCEVEVMVVENIIPTVARTAIANALTDASPSPSSLLINYIALGSGTNSPANGDTTLQTEVYRNAIASLTNSSNIAYATGFFTSTETTGTYREVGLFIHGTSSADSGTMLSRAAINVTKSGTETLTIDYTITIS